MLTLWWQPVLSWALSAFFALGSWLNASDPKSIAAYRVWGYPDWFHFVTAAMELVTAVLLVMAATRLYGASIGCIVMAGAISTLLIHDEFSHALLPMAIFALLAVVGWAAYQA